MGFREESIREALCFILGRVALMIMIFEKQKRGDVEYGG